MTKGDVANPFLSPEAAARYAAGRPEFHPEVLGAIRDLTGIAGRVARGLDVGCGTGMSTRLLAQLADSVVGIDVAPAMLAHASRASGAYAAARAERLPFVDDAFDLLTIGAAFHWLDRDRFAGEAERVCRRGAQLVIYDHAFAANLEGRPEFRRWFCDEHLSRWPTPPRLPRYTAGETLGSFTPIGTRDYSHVIPLARDPLVAYLMSQSNVGMLVDAGTVDAASARASITAAVAGFFVGTTECEFRFVGSVSVLALP